MLKTTLTPAKNLNKLLNNGKNFLIFLHLKDCPWCHFVADEVLIPMNTMAEYTDKLNILAIEINAAQWLVDFDNQDLSANKFAYKYNVDFYPTILLFNQQGKLLEKITGVVSQDLYWTNLDGFLAKNQL